MTEARTERLGLGLATFMTIFFGGLIAAGYAGYHYGTPFGESVYISDTDPHSSDGLEAMILSAFVLGPLAYAVSNRVATGRWHSIMTE